MSVVELCFPTLIYRKRLLSRGGERLRGELEAEARQIREFDGAGRKWSAQSYSGGYTSYGSMDRLHQFSSTFDALRRHLDRHVRAYAAAQHWDLQDRPLAMSDCWLNIMPRGCAHSFHLHPHAVVSGTYYVTTPRGASGLKFEDPRLSRQMATPMRLDSAPAGWRSHLTLPARAGEVILFDSWLRHEVAASRIDEERISVSFNYHWG